MDKKTIGKINFDILQKEVKRQFDEQSESLKSLSHLAEILLGFTGVFFIYFLRYIPLGRDFEIIILNFAIPVLIISMAGALGARAFWIGKFPIGMNIRDSKDSVLKNSNIDLRAERFNKLMVANEFNAAAIKEKSRLIKFGYAFYFFGFATFFLVKFIYHYFL